jgi:hypothetical protein
MFIVKDFLCLYNDIMIRKIEEHVVNIKFFLSILLYKEKKINLSKKNTTKEKKNY